jgi:hypothetical protein
VIKAVAMVKVRLALVRYSTMASSLLSRRILTIGAAAGAEERPGFVGAGQEDLAVDDLAGRAREGDAGGVLACSGPLQCPCGVDLRPAPLDHGFHGQDGHTGCALDGGLVVAVDEGAEAEVDEAADEGAVVAVAVQANGEAQGDLLEEPAGRTASASPASRATNRPDEAIARGPEQREVPPRDRCARCGVPIDRETRRNSGYCSTACRDEARESRITATRAANGWAFALDPRLFGVLGPPAVHLWPADLAKVKQQRAAAGPKR